MNGSVLSCACTYTATSENVRMQNLAILLVEDWNFLKLEMHEIVRNYFLISFLI